MRLRPYIPQKLPPKDLDWERLVPWIGEAREALARYDEVIRHMPVSVLEVLKWEEAISTLRSQNIDVKIQEVLHFALDETAEEKRAVLLQKIVNAKAAIDFAVRWRGKNAFQSSFICRLHALFKKDGINPKEIGCFRKRQNWIGAPGCPIHKSYFLPPKAGSILKHFKDLQKYVHIKEEPLLQLAILFAQFLIIHPFMDGNGRVVRCCVPVFLQRRALLAKPFLFLSTYFEDNRAKYLDTLFNISDQRDWEGWILYFLRAVKERSEKMKMQAGRLYALYQETEERIDWFLHPVSLKKEKNFSEKQKGIFWFNPLFEAIR